MLSRLEKFASSTKQPRLLVDPLPMVPLRRVALNFYNGLITKLNNVSRMQSRKPFYLLLISLFLQKSTSWNATSTKYLKSFLVSTAYFLHSFNKTRASPLRHLSDHLLIRLLPSLIEKKSKKPGISSSITCSFNLTLLT